MTRSAVVFWGAALALSLLFTVAAAFLLPYEALRLTEESDRLLAWHLTIWTAGVLSILFGLAGLLTFASPLGFREIHEAGSLSQAREARRRAKLTASSFHRNFAWWLICTGMILIALYFVAWGTGVRL